MIGFWNFIKGILLRSESSVISYDAENEGSLYNHNDTNIRTQIEGADRAIVTDTQTQTITNKTIDADSNTLSNLSDSNIKSGAAIDATKIHDGSVTNTEFGYLASVTSDIQTQLDAKASDSSLSDHINDTTGAHAASAISSTASGNLAADNVQDALDELQADIDTRALDSDLDAHIADTTDAHAASAITNTPSGNLAATDVQTALDELQSDIDTRALDSDLDAHVNDTTGAHAATAISVTPTGNLAADDVQEALEELQTDVDTRALDSDLTNHMSDTSTHGVTEIVGTSEEQSLSNKTFTDAITLTEITTPSTPSTGELKLYPKDGKLYKLDDAGVEEEVGTGAGGSGGINYFENGGAEDDTTGWVGGTDATPGTKPTDISGGTDGARWTRTTTDPLIGSASFLFTHPASDIQGEFERYDFDIDDAYRGKVLPIKFNYKLVSGTYASTESSSDLIVYIYDRTNATFIEPVNIFIQGAAQDIPCEHVATFQTAIDSTAYSLVIFQSGTGTDAFAMMFDNFSVGPGEVVSSPIITDVESFTATGSFSTNTTYSAVKWRVGEIGYAEYRLSFSGAPDSTTLTLNLPWTINTSKLPDGGSRDILGDVYLYDDSGSGNGRLIGKALYNTTTSVTCSLLDEAAASTHYLNNVTQAAPVTIASGDKIIVSVKAPVTGWESGVTYSAASASNRHLSLEYTGNGGTSLTADVTNIDFATKARDTHSAWNGTTFTAPYSGDFVFSGIIYITASTSSSINLYKNGTFHRKVSTLATDTRFPIRAQIYLEAGDEVTFRSTSSVTLNNNSTNHWLSIHSVSNGSSLIPLSEKIIASYSSNSGQSIPDNTATIIDFEDAETNGDTHGCVTTGASWKFTANRADLFDVSAHAALASSSAWAAGETAQLYLYKNGTLYLILDAHIAEGATAKNVYLHGSTEIYLLANEYIDIRILQGSGGSIALRADSASNKIKISSKG